VEAQAMTAVEQLTGEAIWTGGAASAERAVTPEAVWIDGAGSAERAARETLRRQVARLERQLSSVVAGGFPHIGTTGEQPLADVGGPRLLTLGELERLRDSLAARVGRARHQAAERAELAQRSRALLEEMRREPRRHKFVRLPVADLGEGGCGAWEVRPRLGPIGMLAGWWQVKLSSGCP
jgi:hypothetical protein